MKSWCLRYRLSVTSSSQREIGRPVWGLAVCEGISLYCYTSCLAVQTIFLVHFDHMHALKGFG